MASSLLPVALLALDAGLAVIPPRQDGSKAPAAPWKDYQTEAPTEAQLRSWYSHDITGIGLVCGRVSGGLEMLEFEGRAVAEGLDEHFMDRCDRTGLGELLDRIEAGYLERTPSGGLHLLYRCDEISGNLKLARRPGDAPNTVDVLIETRGEGGYTICAPSNGPVHPSGRPWELVYGSLTTIASISPDERRALLDIARSFDKMPTRTAGNQPQANGERPGDWLSAHLDWPQVLEPHGWICIGNMGDEALWRRPGKTSGVSATTNYAGTDLLKVFSTSTTFDSETTYSRFAAWAHLEHGGDYRAAAKAARILMPVAPSERPAPEQPEDAPSAPRLLSLRWVTDIFATPPAEPPILIQGLLTVGEMCAIAAPRALGKSWLGMNLATLLGRGQGLLAGQLAVRRAARVLYCHGEVNERGAYERWFRMSGSEGPPPGVAETFDRWRIRTISRRSSFRDEDGGGSHSDEWIDALLDGRVEATIVAERIDVLIVDPWAVFYSGKENSNDEVEAALDKLRDLSLRHGLTVILFHHISAKSTMGRHAEPEDLWRGSTRLADWASTRVTLLRHYTDDEAERQNMTRQQARRYVDVHFLRRDEPTPDFSMTMNFTTGWWEQWTPPGRPRTEINIRDIARQCAARGGWASLRQATADLKLGHEKTGVVLEQAILAGLIEPVRGAHNAKAYMPTDAARALPDPIDAEPSNDDPSLPPLAEDELF